MPIDPSTNIGYVRLLIGDMDEASPIFTDDEITAFITNSNSSLYSAAANAIRSLIASKIRLSKKIKREGYESESFAIDELTKIADGFDKQAIASAGLQFDEFTLTDEHFEAYRPKWRDLTTEVIE